MLRENTEEQRNDPSSRDEDAAARGGCMGFYCILFRRDRHRNPGRDGRRGVLRAAELSIRMANWRGISESELKSWAFVVAKIALKVTTRLGLTHSRSLQSPDIEKRKFSGNACEFWTMLKRIKCAPGTAFKHQQLDGVDIVQVHARFTSKFEQWRQGDSTPRPPAHSAVPDPQLRTPRTPSITTFTTIATLTIVSNKAIANNHINYPRSLSHSPNSLFATRYPLP